MDTINDKLDKMLLESKDPTTREIVKMISSTMKLTDLPLELGDNEKYVKNKPFVEERIRQNLKMIELLSSQINDNLLSFITQDFGNSKSKKRNMDNELLNKNAGPSGRFPLYPFPIPRRRPKPHQL
uniref:Mediator complex subunit 15 n=1 Tax=Strongyloides papillosus TaxID=174720 RepID=A0A0N5B3U8_STREA